MQGITKLSMVLLVIGLAICSNIVAWGADWKLLDVSDTCTYFYDKQGITRTSDNRVKVWNKLLYTEKGILEKVKKYGEDFVNLGSALYLWEINCADKNFRILSITYHSNEGKIIDHKEYTDGQSSFIPPDTTMESLYKEVCK